MLQANTLAALPGIRHGFFTRDGGVSDGVYATLNGGIGSKDLRANVDENRTRMAKALGVEPQRLLSCYQIHSPKVVEAREPWGYENTAARRRHRDARERFGDRRVDRGLRAGAVRRSASAGDWRGARRLARRARRRAGGDGWRDGAARRVARAHRRGGQAR